MAAGVALVFLAAVAGMAYVVYAAVTEQPQADAPADGEPPPEPPPPAGPSKPAEPPPVEVSAPDAAATAKVKAATVRLTTYRANGRVTSANGFFVAGPGLIVTDSRAVGLEHQPTRVLSIKVVVGSGTSDARTLEARLLKDDPELGLALLQVTGLDLPDPPAHGVSAGLTGVHDAWQVSVTADGRPAITAPAAVTGRQDVAGPRPWLLLNAALPAGLEGSPICDHTGRVIGIAIPTYDVRTPAAVPIETVQEFVRRAMKLVEAGGLIPVGPPQFPGPAGPQPGRDPAPPPGSQPKLTFPPVAPVEIAAAPLTADRVEVRLPGKVLDACSGGGGRYWILHLPGQLAVFDVAAAKVVKYLPVPAEGVKFAAGMAKLVVADPAAGRLTRYDLTTFEKDLTVPVPVEGPLTGLAMGSASAGPLLIQYTTSPPTSPGTEVSRVTLLDLGSFREIDTGQVTNVLGASVFRPAPDGRVVAGWDRFPGSRATVFTISPTGVSQRSFNETGGGPPVPAEDGTLCCPRGLFSTALRPLVQSGQTVLRVPAQQGPAYLSVAPRGSATESGAVTITAHMLGDHRPLLTLPDTGARFAVAPWAARGILPDRRVFFCPAGKLLGLIGPNDDTLILVRFDLDAEVERSGVDYLYVASRPPVAEPGRAFRYPVGVRSKKGGVKLRLDAGPPGMRVEGTAVVWDVPAAWAKEEAVRLIVSDAGGLEMAYTFTLAVKDK